MPKSEILVSYLGRSDYQDTWAGMKDFTQHRDPFSKDQIWVTEHEPIFTQGLNGKPEHLLCPGDIPVAKIDRGGQVTYHGPGQLVVYCLLDIKRLGIGVKSLVTTIENSILELLCSYAIVGHTRTGAPGVYVDDAKIAALGLRIRKGCCYHGLSLNVDMNLEPFSRINPCGYRGMAVTQLSDLGIDRSLDQVGRELAVFLTQKFGGSND